MKTLERPSFESEKKLEKKETEAKYNFEAIAELEKPMESLTEQLKESIDKGEYDTLISDDAGGRIPTLVMRKVMMARMRKQNPDLTPEQEREALQTYFVAGGQAELNEDAFKELLDKDRLKPKKVLLVTELISSGDSMRKLGDLLESAKIDFDFTAAESDFDRNHYRGEIYNRHLLYIGKDNTHAVPQIYGLKFIIGVEKKNSPEGAYLEIYNPEGLGYIEEDKARVWKKQRENVIKSRHDIDLMAKKILERVWPEK